MKLAIYSPNWIGDAVLTMPFLNACRRRFPEAHITVAAKDWVAEVYRHHPAVDRLIELPSRALRGLGGVFAIGRRLRRDRPDRCYLLTDSLRSAAIARLSGSVERIGFRGQGRSPLLTEALAPPGGALHRSRRYLMLLKEAADAALPEGPGLTLTIEEIAWATGELDRLGLARPLAVLPGSMAPARRIPAERWAGFLAPFAEAGQPLLMLGGNRDAETAREVVNRLPPASARSVCGDYSLRQSAALISRCQGALAADSGLGHVAASLQVPTVSVFGSEDPSMTRPLGLRTAVVRQPVHCSPCRKNDCHNRAAPLLCLSAIPARALWEAYASL